MSKSKLPRAGNKEIVDEWLNRESQATQEPEDPRTIEQIFQDALKAKNAIAEAANERLKGKDIKQKEFKDLHLEKQKLIDNLQPDQGNALVVMSIVSSYRANEAYLKNNSRISKWQPAQQKTLKELEDQHKAELANQTEAISKAKAALKQKDADFFAKDELPIYGKKFAEQKKDKSRQQILDAKQAINTKKNGLKWDQKELGKEIRKNRSFDSTMKDIKNIAKKMANMFLSKSSKYTIEETERDKLRAEQKMLGRVIRSGQITGVVDKIRGR